MLLKIHKKQTMAGVGGGRQSSVWIMHANMHLTCTDNQNKPCSGATVVSRPLPRPAGSLQAAWAGGNKAGNQDAVISFVEEA